MAITLNRDSNTITIANFYENYALDKYNFNPPYQRKSVWSDEKQSFLIDSILKNLPIPPIFLRQHIDDESGVTSYDVIDGKQRLNSIIRFILNEIPVSNELADSLYDENLAGAYFKDLDTDTLSEYKKKFWRYIVPIEYIDTTDEDVIDNVFDRLNRNGEPLTGQELRNAKYHNTIFLKAIKKLADEDFWNTLLFNLELKRMENEEFISELLFVILEEDILEAKPMIIDRLYDKYSTIENDTLELVLTIFQESTKYMVSLNLDYDLYKIKGVSHIYGLWCFSWHCYINNIPNNGLSDKLNNLFTELREGSQNDLITGYKKTMTSNTKSKSQRQRRLNVLLQYCEIIPIAE